MLLCYVYCWLIRWKRRIEMAVFKEYEDYDGMGIAELIRNGEVSTREVLEAAIETIERINPKINAVITKMYDEAERAISRGLPDGPFKGVPVMLKDILQMYAGVRYTMGSKLLSEYVAPIDSEYVKRIKASGAVILGKTNVPEFGLMGTTEPEYFGATRNPWDTQRTPGGSSGGSAAAVAARMVPIATGNDGGGSIRIPASCCGLFGLKPSRGRTPNGPVNGEVWMGLVVEHVLTRSVRDSAAMLDATCGADIGAPFEIRDPEVTYTEAMKRKPEFLRVAFTAESPLGGKIHPACSNAIYKAAELLSDMGFTVEEDKPEIDFSELAESYIVAMFGEVKVLFMELEEMLGKPVKSSDVEITSWILGKIGEFAPMWKLNRAKRVWDRAARSMGAFHQKYDVYMTPTMASPPAYLGDLLPSTLEKGALSVVSSLGIGKLISIDEIIEKVAYRQLEKMPFTQLANQTGQPAMSVPMYWNKRGLPIGIQFIAPFGREDLLFGLAALLEEVKPWRDKKPSVV